MLHGVLDGDDFSTAGEFCTSKAFAMAHDLQTLEQTKYCSSESDVGFAKGRSLRHRRRGCDKLK